MKRSVRKNKKQTSRVYMVKSTIIVTVVFYVLNILSKGAVVQAFKLEPTSILHPLELWKLLSVALVHGSFTHIFFNMYSLWLFGIEIEKKYGARFFLILYTIFLAGSSAFWCLLQLTSGNLMTSAIGASGGITGIITFYTLTFPNRKFFILPFPFPIPAWLLGFIIVAQDMSGLLKTNEFGSDGIAYAAHLGGAGCGLIVYFVYKYLKKRR